MTKARMCLFPNNEATHTKVVSSDPCYTSSRVVLANNTRNKLLDRPSSTWIIDRTALFKEDESAEEAAMPPMSNRESSNISSVSCNEAVTLSSNSCSLALMLEGTTSIQDAI